MAEGRWEPQSRASLADRRVMVLGYGAIGSAVGRRLEAFEADVVRVGRTARDVADGHVHGVDELLELLPDVEILVCVLPLDDATEHLVDAEVLAALPRRRAGRERRPWPGRRHRRPCWPSSRRAACEPRST